ncbi:unnamed protein product [Spirodela intermedia]|uniref:Uncharacterized protein n=2 Tax=Spirodela intermedia TaxID=51605 RepID=A0A7I8L4Y2_SPIIN|nr:unnamed protein product [Spirodela intermedia]CAA6667620.1 unnamed protein product [Spirodela intermedia]CAA7404438.1 unnamed protein product [Spirodela intermedia]
MQQPPLVKTTFSRKISYILTHKFTNRGGHHSVHKHTDFLIRWEGDSHEATMWHHKKDL